MCLCCVCVCVIEAAPAAKATNVPPQQSEPVTAQASDSMRKSIKSKRCARTKNVRTNPFLYKIIYILFKCSRGARERLCTRFASACVCVRIFCGRLLLVRFATSIDRLHVRYRVAASRARCLSVRRDTPCVLHCARAPNVVSACVCFACA